MGLEDFSILTLVKWDGGPMVPLAAIAENTGRMDKRLRVGTRTTNASVHLIK